LPEELDGKWDSGIWWSGVGGVVGVADSGAAEKIVAGGGAGGGARVGTGVAERLCGWRDGGVFERGVCWNYGWDLYGDGDRD
jgi:hypothetical protein